MILKEELKKLNPHNKEKLNNKLDDIDNLWLKSYILELLELQREETIREVIQKVNEVCKTNNDTGRYGDGFEKAIDLIINKLKK